MIIVTIIIVSIIMSFSPKIYVNQKIVSAPLPDKQKIKKSQRK